MMCTYCGSAMHDTDHCPKTANGQGNLNRRYCTYCGSKAHYIENCPKTWRGSLSNRGIAVPYTKETT